MKQRKLSRRLLSVLLAFVMCLTLVPDALAAETATTMQLMKKEGTVTVASGSGKSVSSIEKMRLYNGYHVKTEQSSYAWISLDSAKLSKLDAVSEVEIRKSGKKLELLLSEGNLFFNVTEPLNDDETLNIRTSTMMVGIRGTSGWVKVLDQWRSEIFVLEGSVEVSVTDPVTGEAKTEIVSAGESAMGVVYDQDRSGDKCEIVRERYAEGDVEGFVLTEVVPDGGLCGEIYDDSGLDLRNIPETEARERLRQDQEDVGRKLDEIQRQVDRQDNNISTNAVWSNPVADGTGTKPAGNSSSTGSNGSTGGNYQPTPDSPSNQSVVTLYVRETNAAEVNRYLNSAGVQQVVVRPGGSAGRIQTMAVREDVSASSGYASKCFIEYEMTMQATERTVKNLLIRYGHGCNSWAQTGTATSFDEVSITKEDPAAWDDVTKIIYRFHQNIPANCDIPNFDLENLKLAFGEEIGVDNTTSEVYVDNDETNDLTDSISWGAFADTYLREAGTGGSSNVTGNSSDLLNIDTAVTVPAGKTLTLQDGVSLRVPDGQTLSVSGTLTVGGVFTKAPGGTVSPANSAVIRAKGFDLMSSEIPGWKVSGTADNAGYYSLVKAQAEPDASGKAGDNVFWSYTAATKTLRIWGSGPMANFGVDAMPWRDYREEIEAVEIVNGVTSIGVYAFGDHINMSSVSIPSSVTRIDNWAFVWCTFLANVTIPNSVTYIGSHAFDMCGSLKTLTIPGSVTSIGDSAFQYCSFMTSVTIQEGVSNTNIGNNAFANCDSLTTATYRGTEDQWKAKVSVGSGNELLTDHLTFAGGTGSSSSSSGEGWRIDGTTLYIESNVPMVDYETVQSTPWYGQRSDIKAVEVGNQVTVIGKHAFAEFPNMTNINIPSSVTSIGDLALYSCYGLQSVTIPSSVISIGNNALGRCSGLTNVIIPDSVTRMGTSVFINCSGLSNVTVGSGVTSIEYGTFSGCTSLKSVTIRGRVTSIGSSAFYNCIGLTDITIPDDVESIGVSAFNSCSNLETVTLPSSLTSISTNAFVGCTGLTAAIYKGTKAQWDANVDPGNGNGLLLAVLTCAGETGEASGNVTSRLDGTTLYFEGVGAMDDYTETSRPWNSDRGNITAVEIADTVTSIGSFAFYSCTNLTSVTIPAGVTSIGASAFNNCDSLTSIRIPANVTAIGDYAFTECDNLTTVTFNSGSKLTSIGNNAFRTSGLTSITLPNGVTSIGTNAFMSCQGLTSFTIPNGVTYIGASAFNTDLNLATVYIPASVKTIGNNAFAGCNALSTVNYSGTQPQWEALTASNTFGTGNTKLTEATVNYTAMYTLSLLSNAAPTYTDVPSDAWYADAVAYCRDNGLMNGTSATEFSPDGTLTRAMMVTVLHRLAGRPSASTAASFTDVKPGQWYTEAVSWASGEKIVLGYNETTFGTNDPVTHEQAALIMQRYSGDANVKTYGAETPKAPATRAEIAATLLDYAENRLTPGTLAPYSAMNVMCAPSGIAADGDGSLLVTDLYHKQVWRVVNRSSTSYAGGATVEDLYGQPVGGYNDAGLDGSYFKEPWAIAPFLNGWAVSDTENNVVRLIQGGSVRTLNGATNEKLTVTDLGVAFDHPTGLAADDDGNLYVADTFSGAVRKVTPEGGVSTAAKGLSEPTGLCWKDGVLYVAESGKNRIVKVEDGKVVNISGQYGFDAPQGVCVGRDGSVYAADTGNGAVCRIKDGKVTVLVQAGSGLTSPVGLLELDGRLYICDTFARKVFVYQM